MDCVYAKAANGMMVRVPKDQLASWKKAQDEMRRTGNLKGDPEIAAYLKSYLTTGKAQ